MTCHTLSGNLLTNLKALVMEPITEKLKIDAAGPKPWINCVRPGNPSCAHPMTCTKNNKCHYSWSQHWLYEKVTAIGKLWLNASARHSDKPLSSSCPKDCDSSNYCMLAIWSGYGIASIAYLTFHQEWLPASNRKINNTKKWRLSKM